MQALLDAGIESGLLLLSCHRLHSGGDRGEATHQHQCPAMVAYGMIEGMEVAVCQLQCSVGPGRGSCKCVIAGLSVCASLHISGKCGGHQC